MLITTALTEKQNPKIYTITNLTPNQQKPPPPNPAAPRIPLYFISWGESFLVVRSL